MKTSKKILLLITVFTNLICMASNLEGGLLIKEIKVTKFPFEIAGKKIDKDGNPDLYFKFFENNKEKGESETIKNCQKNTTYTFSGKNLPFRVTKESDYILQLMDWDSDKGIGKNKDEVISKLALTYSSLITQFGVRNSYSLTDSATGVAVTIYVEHVDEETAAGEKIYIKYVKPIDQRFVAPKNKVMEGCGPIAAAMIMGYWQTEHGYNIMNPNDHFDGTEHPTQTILDFRDKADTKAWGDQEQSATRKMKMEDALAHFAKKANEATPNKAKLKVDMMWSIRRWDEKKSKLKKELREGSPVILLLKKMPPCLTGKWVNATKVFGDHYIVVVGFDDAKKTYYVMPGWKEANKSTSYGPEAHAERDLAHCECSYNEIKEADPSLIWIKR